MSLSASSGAGRVPGDLPSFIGLEGKDESNRLWALCRGGVPWASALAGILAPLLCSDENPSVPARLPQSGAPLPHPLRRAKP